MGGKNSRKHWDDVTVTCWIAAKLCTRVDLIAGRLRVNRREALERLLPVFLQMDALLRDIESEWLRERKKAAFKIVRGSFNL